MSPFFTSYLQLRLGFIVCAAVFLVLLCNERFRNKALGGLTLDLDAAAYTNVRKWLLFASLIYFCVTGLSKYSQLQARVLNGTDFWLIEDIFRHIANGQPFITRFALQSGPLQHGGLHAYLTTAALIPTIKLIGSTWTALLLIPFSFALTGYLIGRRLLKSTSSPLLVLGLPLAFWMSEWTNRILLYDTHPEALYAPLIFLTFLASERLLCSRRLIDWGLFLLSWVTLSGVKQDALIYSSVLCFFLFVTRKKMRGTPALLAFTCVASTFVAMTWLIALFKSGQLGPYELALGEFIVPVAKPMSGAAGLSGHVISGLSDLGAVIHAFMPDGLFAFVKRSLLYLVFSPFTMMTLIAPWLWLKRSFWLMVAPIVLLIGGINNLMAGLQTYYSINFICFIWLSLILEVETAITKKAHGFLLATTVWTLAFCAIHGGSSPIFYFPNSLSEKTGVEASLLVQKQKGLGIVSSRLLHDVDSEKVWSDSPPTITGEEEFSNPPEAVKWVLFPKVGESYEFNRTHFSSWREWALSHGWRQVDGEFVYTLIRN